MTDKEEEIIKRSAAFVSRVLVGTINAESYSERQLFKSLREEAQAIMDLIYPPELD